MLDFVLLMLFPLLIAAGVLFGFKGKVTLGEFFAQIGAVALMIMLGLGIAYWSGTTDVEVWNGQVTERENHHTSCEHSYECNCYYTNECTGTGNSRSCSMVRHCSTCYEHAYDVDWTVHSSTGESVNISRVDRQGLDMPPRWAAAFAGEPYSSSHAYENYIMANPDSVLLGTKGDVKLFGPLIPKYPANIYDYYKHDPVINMGVPGLDVGTWDWLIREVNKQLGPTKQVNVIVILVPTSDRAYMLALKDAWVGGKKNDVDVVIGSKSGHEIDFAEVMSWSTNKAMAVDLKNRIQDIGTLDRRDDIQHAILHTVNNEFVRMHMKNMRWLMRSFQPSTTVMVWLFIIAILLEVGLAWWAITNDITVDTSKGTTRRQSYGGPY
jgi:hypothetical protein